MHARFDRYRNGLIAASLLCAVGTACGHADNSNSGNVPPPPPVVIAGTVEQKTVPITDDVQGTVNAITSVEVRARVQGILEAALFKEGSLVKKNQLIIRLQKNQYEAALLSAQAQLLSAKASLQQAQQQVPVQQAQANLEQKQAIYDRSNITVARVRPLVATQALPQKDLDNALASQAASKADVDVAQAQLTNAKVNQTASIESAQAAVLSGQAAVENAQINLGYTDVYAPVTGLIGFLKYDVGNVVGDTPTTQVIDEITTVDPIKVNFSIDENTYLALIKLGKGSSQASTLRAQQLQLVLSDNSIYPETGTIYAANPTLDAKTGTIAVEARFPNPDGALRPGQFARIRLQVENRPNALLIPQTAVFQTQGVSTVYTIDAGGLAALHTVELGPAYGHDYVVLDGVKAGDRIIVQGAQKVQPGMKVQVKGS